MGRNFLAFTEGDANNAVLAAVGYNFSLLLNWLRLLCAFFLALFATAAARRSRRDQPDDVRCQPHPTQPCSQLTIGQLGLLHGRLITHALQRAEMIVVEKLYGHGRRLSVGADDKAYGRGLSGVSASGSQEEVAVEMLQ